MRKDLLGFRMARVWVLCVCYNYDIWSSLARTMAV